MHMYAILYTLYAYIIYTHASQCIVCEQCIIWKLILYIDYNPCLPNELKSHIYTHISL